MVRATCQYEALSDCCGSRIGISLDKNGFLGCNFRLTWGFMPLLRCFVMGGWVYSECTTGND